MEASGDEPPRHVGLKRTALVIGSALAAINIWTGAPLFAVWVGSKVQGSFTTLSMTAVFSVIAIFAVLVFGLAWLLSRMNAAYDDLVGRPAAARQTSPWLRSMRDERTEHVREKYGISAIEKVVVIAVVGAVLAFEIWFFFFAGSSLPNQ
jgi:hypothetical protein